MRKIYAIIVFCLIISAQFTASAIISTPTLSSPSNNATVYGTSASLYWNKNNNDKIADYYVKVVDLTTLTAIYNYTSVGDLPSFEAQNLVVGHTYSWLIRAVSRADVNDVLETGFSNFTVSNTSTPTLSITSLSGTTFCGSNTSVTINYSRTGSFNSGQINYGYVSYNGNIFVELSDKNGLFTNPVLINGTSVSTNTGSLLVTIPSNLFFGQNYKMRLMSYGSIVTSSPSATMTIGTVNYASVNNRFDEGVTGGGLNLCQGSSATIKTSLTDTTNTTFQWKKDNINIAVGGNYSKYTATTGGRYTLAITQGTCPIINPTSGPQITMATGNIDGSYLYRESNNLQCIGGETKLRMLYWSDNLTYKWFKDDVKINGETQRSYKATQSGIYTARATDGGCTITAKSDPLIFGNSINISSYSFGPNNICPTGGQTSASINVVSSQNLTTAYQWKRNGQSISGATSNYLTITQAGVYNAEVTQGICVVTSQGFDVKASNALDSIVVIQNRSLCYSGGVNLTVNSSIQNASFTWTKNGVSVGSGSFYTATSDGNYTLTATQGTCNTVSKPSVVSLNAAPDIFLYLAGNSNPLRDTVFICTDSPQTISIKNNNYSGITYQWLKDNVAINGATSSNYLASQRGSYTVRLTSSFCVVVSKPIFIENTFPKFSLYKSPQGSTSCSNNVYSIGYVDKGFYPFNGGSWRKDGILLDNYSTQLYAIESGIYSAIIQQGSCIVESEALKITIGEPTTATISGNSTIASGGSAKLYVSFTGTSPWIFTLSDGTTVTTSQNPYILTVNPNISTTYTLSSLIGNCGNGTVSGNAVITVGACATPTVIVTQPVSQAKCTGSSVTFSVTVTGGGNLTYQWKKDGQNISGEISSILTMSNLKPSDLGNYSVEVTGSCGMVLSNVAILKINNAVPFNVSPSSVSSVMGSTVSLQAYAYSGVPVSSYSWKGPNGYTSNAQNVVLQNVALNNAGIYTAFASNGQGCVGQAAVSVSVITAPITLGNLANTNFCPGQTSTLAFTTSSSADPTIYAVQISNSGGTFGSSPTVLGTGSSSPITFTLPSYSSGTNSNYKLRIVDTQNSTQISSPSPTIFLNLLVASVGDVFNNSYISVCSGSSVKLYAKTSIINNSNTVYEWQKDGVVITGIASNNYVTNQAGSYKVKAMQTGCNSNLSNEIYIYSTPSPSSGFSGSAEQYQCAGGTLLLKAYYNSENASYTWKKDGIVLSNTINSLAVTQSGTYSLQATDPNCTIVYPSSQTLTFGATISAKISSSDTISSCPNYSSTYIGAASNIDGYIYQWKKDGVPIANENRNYYFAYNSGVYSLQVTQGNCSAVSKSVVVNLNAAPSNVIKSAGSPNICVGTTPTALELQGSGCGASYQWQKDGIDIPSQTSTSYLPSQSGSYRTKITFNSSVSYSNAISITAGNTPTYEIYTFNDTITCLPYSTYYLRYSSNNTPNITFQWYKDGSPLSNSAYSSLSTNSFGSYKLQVTLGSCVGYSQNVNLVNSNYLRKPTLATDQGKIICGNNYTTLLTPYIPVANYTWKKNGVIFDNSPYSTNISQSGNYTVSITQGTCTAESDPIKINIGDKQQSIKTADWSNAATWSCGTIPTVAEDVLINKTHTVSLPNGYTGFLKNLENNGSIIQGINSQLKFLQN